LCRISTRLAGEMVSVLIIFFGFCGSENGTCREVACEKLADATVLKNGFMSCRKVEGRGACCCIWNGFRWWSPVNGRVKGSIEPCYVRVFQPANMTSKSLAVNAARDTNQFSVSGVTVPKPFRCFHQVRQLAFSSLTPFVISFFWRVMFRHERQTSSSSQSWER